MQETDDLRWPVIARGAYTASAPSADAAPPLQGNTPAPQDNIPGPYLQGAPVAAANAPLPALSLESVLHRLLDARLNRDALPADTEGLTVVDSATMNVTTVQHGTAGAWSLAFMRHRMEVVEFADKRWVSSAQLVPESVICRLAGALGNYSVHQEHRRALPRPHLQSEVPAFQKRGGLLLTGPDVTNFVSKIFNCWILRPDKKKTTLRTAVVLVLILMNLCMYYGMYTPDRMHALADLSITALLEPTGMAYVQQVDRQSDGNPDSRTLQSGFVLSAAGIAVTLLATPISLTAWAVALESGAPVEGVKFSVFHTTLELSVRSPCPLPSV